MTNTHSKGIHVKIQLRVYYSRFSLVFFFLSFSLLLCSFPQQKKMNVYSFLVSGCWLGRIFIFFDYYSFDLDLVVDVCDARSRLTVVQRNRIGGDDDDDDSHSIVYSIHWNEKKAKETWRQFIYKRKNLPAHTNNMHIQMIILTSWIHVILFHINISLNEYTLCVKRSDWICVVYTSAYIKMEKKEKNKQQHI